MRSPGSRQGITGVMDMESQGNQEWDTKISILGGHWGPEGISDGTTGVQGGQRDRSLGVTGKAEK